MLNAPAFIAVWTVAFQVAATQPTTQPAAPPTITTGRATVSDSYAVSPAEAATAAAEARVYSRLEEMAGPIHITNATLEDALRQMGTLIGVSMHVNWEDLAANGVPRDKSASINVRDVTYGTALELLLQDASGDVHLDFEPRVGTLVVATKDRLDKDKVTRAVPVRDLIIALAVEAAQINDRPLMRDTALPSADLIRSADVEYREALARAALGKPDGSPVKMIDAELLELGESTLLDLIRQNIEPDSWRETGGGDGAVRGLNGVLVIYNTRNAHRKVVGLLSALRAAGAAETAWRMDRR